MGKIHFFLKGIFTMLRRLASGFFLIFIPAISLNAQKTSLVHGGLKRIFKIYNPSTSVPLSHPPLVIVLHGRGGTGSSMILVTRGGFNKLADRDGFIVVYPDGIELNWNDGRIDEEARDRAHSGKAGVIDHLSPD